ncbi:50S ribosome-binding GTPase [Haloactinopolyspora alba]|uniref:50S ribosome-binding GTPase n=1 Tax=Haloactinopolyspora alba TaxID=648780 RepID=A0A2P8DHF6_9ACTN|nr:GTPase [Haloactinopolyspora alba]PSK96645.1 50S ribosome-binding GTPase [Haloactinopolyspora alba]
MTPWPQRERVSLPQRLRALEEVLSTAAGRVPAELTEPVQAALDDAGARREVSVEHTVVALAGATGSGKSSLFNAVAGMDLSRVGVRRPTTSEPMACVWGTQGVVPLLEWLGVPQQRQLSRESVLDSGEADDLDGLVLLDLPDHDSTHEEHRESVDRLVEQVDLFVWVLDPQKYADAAVHERYLRPLSSHQAVTVVVLNQTDRLGHDDVAECVTDLRALLDEDGLPDVPIVPLSAATGHGLEALVDVVRTAVTKRRAVEERAEADARAIAEQFAVAVGVDGQPPDDAREDSRGSTTSGADRERLVDSLFEASGADVVAGAAGRSFLLRARASTGWLPTRWISRLRRKAKRAGLPEPTSVQRARAATAVREFGDAAASETPAPWRDSVRAVAATSAERFPDALDAAVAAADLGIGTRPGWWRTLNLVQWTALLTVLAGAGWQLTTAGPEALRLDLPAVDVAGVALPWLVIGAGVLVGWVVGVCGLVAARRGADRQAAAVRETLHEVVERTAGEVVVEPVDTEVSRFRQFHRALARARSA